MAAYETVLRKNVLGFVYWHWHEELQLCLVTGGRVEVSAAGAGEQLEAEDGFFVNSGVPHTVRPLSSDAEYFCVNVRASLLCGPTGSALGMRYIVPLCTDKGMRLAVLTGEGWQKEICRALKKVRRLFVEQPHGFELAVTGVLLEAFQQLLAGMEPKRLKGGDPGCVWMKDVLEFLNGHCSEKVSLAQLAGIAGLCPSEFCRVFKRTMGYTAFDYLCNLRVSKSAEMLAGCPEATVNRIAYECGFSTASAYIGQFRRRTGLTPGQYRRMLRQDAEKMVKKGAEKPPSAGREA